MGFSAADKVFELQKNALIEKYPVKGDINEWYIKFN
jgi:hypothetical protein